MLTAAANVLHEYGAAAPAGPAPAVITAAEYWALLLQYVKQHTSTAAANDTAVPAGSGHVFENLHPDLGYWNNRAIMYWADKPTRVSRPICMIALLPTRGPPGTEFRFQICFLNILPGAQYESIAPPKLQFWRSETFSGFRFENPGWFG